MLDMIANAVSGAEILGSIDGLSKVGITAFCIWFWLRSEKKMDKMSKDAERERRELIERVRQLEDQMLEESREVIQAATTQITKNDEHLAALTGLIDKLTSVTEKMLEISRKCFWTKNGYDPYEDETNGQPSH
jgi:hypothetical protein